MLDQAEASTHELRAALLAFDEAFRSGQIDEFAGFIADDAELLVHNEPAMYGRAAIVSSFAELFKSFDTSSYEPSYERVEVHDERACVLASFEEVLQSRSADEGVRVHGRTVQFWQREQDGQWRVTMALTARSAPDEPTG